MVSVFRSVIEFFDRLGVYDVLLPFILVFAIVFAILEKTMVLGTETDGKQTIPRRHLNSLIAFVVAFFVVASTSLVRTISEATANVVVLLMVSVFFLILIGSFHKQGEPIYLENYWKTGGMIVMLIGVVLIFLQALKTKTGVSWLEWGWAYVINNWDGTIVGTIALLLILILAMYFVVKKPAESGD